MSASISDIVRESALIEDLGSGDEGNETMDESELGDEIFIDDSDIAISSWLSDRLAKIPTRFKATKKLRLWGDIRYLNTKYVTTVAIIKGYNYKSEAIFTPRMKILMLIIKNFGEIGKTITKHLRK